MGNVPLMPIKNIYSNRVFPSDKTSIQ